jgi:hypothetical protein
MYGSNSFAGNRFPAHSPIETAGVKMSPGNMTESVGPGHDRKPERECDAKELNSERRVIKSQNRAAAAAEYQP